MVCAPRNPPSARTLEYQFRLCGQLVNTEQVVGDSAEIPEILSLQRWVKKSLSLAKPVPWNRNFGSSGSGLVSAHPFPSLRPSVCSFAVPLPPRLPGALGGLRRRRRWTGAEGRLAPGFAEAGAWISFSHANISATLVLAASFRCRELGEPRSLGVVRPGIVFFLGGI